MENPPPLVGTVFFLRLGNRLLRSYLDPKLDSLQRITFVFYVMFATEAWFTDLKEKDSMVKKSMKLAEKELVARMSSEKNCSKKAVRQELAKEKKEIKAAEREQRARKASNKKSKTGCVFLCVCV